MKTTIFYRRKLPHIQPLNGDFFVTFRLKMQLPDDIADKLNKIYQGNKTDHCNPGWSAYSNYFKEFDNFLDLTKSGPKYLSDNRITNMIMESLHFRDGKEYELVCYTIMSNHVHMVVVNTRKYLYKIMHSFKRYTGYAANKILNREGSFWQREYTDRIIRNEEDLIYHIDYTLNNPVKANLVKHWKEWPYSYLNKKYEVGPIANRTGS
jgi:REP element-mobilizing transposase RayT